MLTPSLMPTIDQAQLVQLSDVWGSGLSQSTHGQVPDT